MKQILFIACLLCTVCAVQSHAQMTPKYQYTSFKGTNSAAIGFIVTSSVKLQWIYRPSELPGLPAGPIRSVYFRVGGTYVSPAGDSFSITHNPTVYDSMRVKMGYTQDTAYKDTLIGGYTYYMLKKGLTQVFFQPSFTVYGADSVGTWVRFPIDGEFSYNPTTNLVVELSRTSQAANNGFDWMAGNGCSRCVLGAEYDSIITGARPMNLQADIGFNDATGAVGELSTLKGFYTYPNPSQGLFTVGFEPFGSNASSVQVSVSDMAGRQVWQRSYEGVRADLFTANVDLRGRPKGIYLLRVQAGEAQALQRVVLE